MANVIEIRDLSKTYTGFKLDNLSLDLEEGTIVGLVGANGAGKSTTIKLILNLIRRDSGTVRVFGRDNIIHASEIKQEIGVVFDEPCFHSILSPKHIARYMRSLYRDWDDDLFVSYLRRFELPDNKKIKEYSRGMKMKLSIAAAMAHKPRLLILDEPTSGLDPLVRDEILDIFLEYLQNDRNSILLSSHITSDLEKVADTVALIDKGRLVFHQEKDVLIDGHLLVKGGKELLSAVPNEELIGIRENRFGFEALTKNKSLTRRFPELISERPNIEEIMLFYTRGNHQ
ncbi:MAG: ABC transporter ATP-binding protein [Clostridiales bacterium]|jgi:ABC-2 type transport system ATP-binding protein|nr:ABC transporter ATP-binding protein [Clostridiales bacterium]